MSQENVEIVQRAWEASDRGDTQAVFALYDPAIVWESHYVGHEAVSFTLDCYSHPVPAMQEDAAEKVAALLE